MLRVFLFHRYTNRAGYLQRTSYLQLEDAPSVLVLWAYCAYSLASRAGALCGGKVGCSRYGWTDGGGLVEESPGGLGGVGSPFLSRGVKLAKSSEPSHFGLPVTKFNMEELYLCDADSLYVHTYINRT